jgi:hypothetical protein
MDRETLELVFEKVAPNFRHLDIEYIQRLIKGRAPTLRSRAVSSKPRCVLVDQMDLRDRDTLRLERRRSSVADPGPPAAHPMAEAE